MKHTKYIITGGLSLVIIASAGAYFTFATPKALSPLLSNIQSTIVNTTEANPDYICIKQITDAPCGDLNNPPWNGSQTRVRTGHRITAVSYINTRTSCEAGYQCETEKITVQEEQQICDRWHNCHTEMVDKLVDTGRCKTYAGNSGASGRQ